MNRMNRMNRSIQKKQTQIQIQPIGKWLDAKCDNCFSVTDEPSDNGGYSYAYSTYMADLDTDLILVGSNRSNAFYLMSQILGYLGSLNTTFNIPYVSRDRRFVRSSANTQTPAPYREFGFGISEQSLYYFIYTCSTRYVKRYAPYTDEYTTYAQRQLRLSYADAWADRNTDSRSITIKEHHLAEEYLDDYSNLDESDHTYSTEGIDRIAYISRSEFTDTARKNFDIMLNHLNSEMTRLLDCAREVHNVIIAPFINSSDCSLNIMRYVSDQDDWAFVEFVKSSSTYRIMRYLVCVLEDHKKNVLEHNYA